MAKIAKILRGLPGSGKTTFVRENLPGAVVCSADHLFEDPQTGEYRFDRTRISEAHQACFRKFVEACQAGEPLVVADNTATSVTEVAPYVLAAQAYGYEAEIISLRCDLATALERNVHAVPSNVVELLARQLADEEARFAPWWQHRVVG